jgi:hypothetical protein
MREMVLSPEQVAEAQAEFGRLIGVPLVNFWGYMSYRLFEFGEPILTTNRKGEEILEAEWSLRLICNWRVEWGNGLSVSRDLFEPEFPEDNPTVEKFYAEVDTRSRALQAVNVYPDASLHLQLTDGFDLIVNPSAEEVAQVESWVLTPRDPDRQALWLWEDDLIWVGKRHRPR